MPPFSHYLRGLRNSFFGLLPIFYPLKGFWKKITEENSKLAKKK